MFLRLDHFQTCAGSPVDRTSWEDNQPGAPAILSSPRTVVGGGQGGSQAISGPTLTPVLYPLPSGALALAWKGVVSGLLFFLGSPGWASPSCLLCRGSHSRKERTRREGARTSSLGLTSSSSTLIGCNSSIDPQILEDRVPSAILPAPAPGLALRQGQ